LTGPDEDDTLLPQARFVPPGLGWGNNQFTRRRRFTFNSIMELPFGRGKPFAREGLLNAVFGGWPLPLSACCRTSRPHRQRRTFQPHAVQLVR
jgi:hypothetical protein